MIPSNVLPRRDLREDAFRKYEFDIAKACHGSFTKEKGTMSSSTYALRLKDAILGYKRYNYKSEVIPKNADISNIKVMELDNGDVYIYNPVIDAIKLAASQRVLHARDWQMIQSVAQKLVSFQLNGEYEIHWTTPDERDKVLSLRNLKLDIEPLTDKPNVFVMYYAGV